MDLYLAQWGDHNDFMLLGVFSSRDKADAVINEVRANGKAYGTGNRGAYSVMVVPLDIQLANKYMDSAEDGIVSER